MSLHHHHFPLAYLFQNRELNELYLSYTIFNFASALITVFIPIYLYKIGYSIAQILIFFLVMSASFVIFSWLGTRITAGIGIKKSMLLSIPLTIAYFLGFRYIAAAPILFYLLPILCGFKNTFYNYSIHLDFLINSKQENRGRQISLLQGVALIGACLAPLAGGLTARFFGFENLFLTGSIFLFISMIPLFFSPEIKIPLNFKFINLLKELAPRRDWPQKLSFTGYAIESSVGGIIWPIFLFLIFSKIELVGYLNAFTAFLTLVVLYFIGRKTDQGDKKKVIRLGTGFYSLSLLSRLFIDNFLSATLIDLYRNVAGHIIHVPWDAYGYQLASTKNPFLFIVSREIIYNLARMIFMPLIVFIFIIDFHSFSVSFAIAAAFSLLYAAIIKNASPELTPDRQL
ncbi:MAG: hypothetical protein Q8O49_00545 [bacterium]|nr:hypothetical protein [bacterium]